MNILHMPQVYALAREQFLPFAKSATELRMIEVEIVWLFLPKLLMPWLMGNSMLGIEIDGSLVGMVDISLQPTTLRALDITFLFVRAIRYGRQSLRPYLCNLLVAPPHRGKGFGKLLVSSSLRTARAWGFAELYLHADENEAASLGLYRGMGFSKVATEGCNALLVRKTAEA